jgi:hypothetical protein
MLSKIVRYRGSCEYCGKKDCILNAHHIISRQNLTIQRFHPMGSICLCPGCHKFSNNSFHKNPIKTMEWLKNNKPEQYSWCISHQREYKWSKKRIERIYRFLTGHLCSIQHIEKDMQEL